MTERPGQGIAVPDMQLFKDSVESRADAPDDVAAWRGDGRRIRPIVVAAIAFRVIGRRIRPIVISAALRAIGSGPVKRGLARQQISDERRYKSAREQV